MKYLAIGRNRYNYCKKLFDIIIWKPMMWEDEDEEPKNRNAYAQE